MPQWVEHILLAEDDEDDLEIFREIVLEVPSNVQLQVVSNGLQLMKTLQLMPRLPDVIFLDLNMPFKNGLQCLKEIREREEWKSLTIIVLTTSSNPEQINRAKELGADNYLVKFTSFNAFKQALLNCLQIQSPVRQTFLISV